MLIPVILSGGAGTRLWPVSRESHPKPFMTLPDGETLLQKTLGRAMQLPGVQQTLTVTNQQYYFHSRDLYRGVPHAEEAQHHFLLEPCGRNTAPAIALAAHWALQQGENPILLVLPADHLIDDWEQFSASVEDAQQLAATGALVTFGIQPSRPETGFGYIETGKPYLSGFHAQRFVEKPDLETAKSYLEQGNFYWNAGMFCFQAQSFLDALMTYQPVLAAQVQQLWDKTDTRHNPVTFSASAFAHLDDISVDYAVMEKSSQVAVVPTQFAWSDIGAWGALSELVSPDSQGNRCDADDVLLVDSQNCYVHGSDRLIAGIGLDGVMIVDTPDALLVMHQDRAQQVKEIVGALKRRTHPAYHTHRTEHRPWGTFTVLDTDQRFKIKRIVVKPGAQLSLQMHHHRAEHWVVVSGTAKVTNGASETLIHANQSTYIPAGTVHRLENPGVIDCVMIEVQVGDYVGEDDIVRMEDSYGRDSLR